VGVFLREIRAYRKSTLIWMAALSGIVALFMGMFPAFTNDVEASRNLLSQLPEALRTAFNIQLANFFTIYGFYGYLLNFALLAGGIQAMNVGAGVISKEVAGKTADFLLSKPVTRSSVLTSKLAAALAVIVSTNVVFSLLAYLAALLMSEDPFGAGTFFLMSFTLFLIQLFFLALGALFAVIIPKIKSPVSVSLPTVFAFYIIGTLGDVLGNENVRYASPFKFYDSTYIINNTALEGRYLALEAVLVVAFIAATYVIFHKKDIRAAA